MDTIAHTFKVGEQVSYAFNGDCYPDGTVAKITKKFLTTSSGRKFFLNTFEDCVYNELSQRYVDVNREVFRTVGGGTWTLVHGHRYEQNPEF
jgi:hypothetical protein